METLTKATTTNTTDQKFHLAHIAKGQAEDDYCLVCHPTGELFAPATFLDRAIRIIERGFSTIPLSGKIPLNHNGAEGRSREGAVIQDWAEKFPTANAAICADGRFIIVESDNEPKLVEWLGRLGAKIPPTFKQQARENRPHWVFRRPSFEVRNLNIHGVFEVKAHNQYVVGFGSLHPEGTQYRIIEDREPAELPRTVWDALLEIRAAGDGEQTRASQFVPLTTVGELRAAVSNCPYFGNWDALLADEGAQQKYRIPETERHFSINKLGATFRNLTDDCLEKRTERMLALRDGFCDDGGRKVTDDEVSRMAAWFEDKQSSPSVPFQIGPAKLESPPISTGDEHLFDSVLGPLPGQLDGVFPLGSVSLVAGSSGSGKSTWAYDMLERQQRGENILGRPSYKRKALVIMHDRSVRELKRTFVRMGIRLSEFPYATIAAEEEQLRIAEVCRRYADSHHIRDGGVLLIEGLDIWIPDVTKANIVAPVLRALRDLAEHYNIAIVGTVGTPKMKPKEQYALFRDRIIGTQVWGRRTETIVVFAEYTEDDKKGHKAGDRDVHVLFRNAKEQRLAMRFSSNGPRKGRMDEVPESTLEVEIDATGPHTARDAFEAWAGGRREFSLLDAVEAFDTIPYRTVARWANELKGWRKSRKGREVLFKQRL